MTLKELAVEYRHSAKLLRNRLRELRALLNKTVDPDEIWHIKRRIAELTPMLTEMNVIADLLEKYYERSYWRNGQYSANCFADRYLTCTKTKTNFAENFSNRTDGSPKGYISSVLYPEKNSAANCSGTRGSQKHGTKDSTQSRRASKKNHKISLKNPTDEELMSVLNLLSSKTESEENKNEEL